MVSRHVSENQNPHSNRLLVGPELPCRPGASVCMSGKPLHVARTGAGYPAGLGIGERDPVPRVNAGMVATPCLAVANQQVGPTFSEIIFGNHSSRLLKKPCA